MGPLARLAATSARLALGQLVFAGAALEALPNDRSGALTSKNSANVPALSRQSGSVRTEAGVSPPAAGWQLPLLDCMGVQPGAIRDSTDGLRYLTAIWPNAAAAGGIVTIGRAAEI